MQSVKRLLVPIDFSPESERALKYAASLARQIDATVVALHVIEDPLEEEGLLSFMLPPDSWPFLDIRVGPRPLDFLLRDRALDLWNFIDRYVPNSSQMKMKRLVRLGALQEEIVSTARAE
ncbi:MAG TPA: universal stress protein, partial [Terriglobales bacterium]|nr:universal stress protein [Terriglobales bacterium]